MNYNEGDNELEKQIRMFESMISEPDGMLSESHLSRLYNSPNTSADGIKKFTDSAKGIVEAIQTWVGLLTQLERDFPNERHITIKIKERYIKCEQHLLAMMDKMKGWNK